ncbi:phage baseplate assembly protein [Luteimonas soli]|uniref:Phage baseplate assembly protein n=1 Tax=Luteimonas soli TaxID=1648966 RepID=A0ABV7XNP5_9GAMM
MADLQLIVAGRAHAGWNRIRVHRGLEEIAGTFDLGVAERWSATVPPLEVRAQDACAVRVDGQTLITGHIDRAAISYDAHNHGNTVSGRDATGDLVDCAAEHGKGEWRNASIAQIARDLCKPFGIQVSVAGDVGAPFDRYAIEPGETAFDCIERAARQRGVRLLSDGRGGLVVGVTPAAQAGVSLVEGENLLSCEVANDASQRFSKYRVIGQRSGDDDTNGASAAQIKATADDAGVVRYRPQVVLVEDQGDIASFQKRARWEASVRAARALTATVRVQGWSNGSGLWAPNQLVRLAAPTARIDRELLVRDVDLVVDQSGTFAELVLTPPDAYTLLPIADRKNAPRRRGRKRADKSDDVFSVGGDA